jgi:hypothetical protein
VCARVDLRKDVGDDAAFINDVGEAARQTGTPSPIGFPQDVVRIAQEREVEGRQFNGAPVPRDCVGGGAPG